MKIAICVNMYYPSIGGCETVCKTLVDTLCKNHEVFIFTHHNKQRTNEIRPYQIIEFYGQADAPSFLKKLKAINPDVIFIYSDLFSFFKYLITYDLKCKMILAMCGANWIHDNQNFIPLFRQNISNFHKIICHSTVDRDYRFCKNAGILDKVIVIPNGVDLQEFDGNTIERNDLMPNCADKIWILNVSNFFPGKGQEHLIKILGDIKEPQNIVYIQVCADIGYPIGSLLEESWQRKVELLKKKGITVKLVKNAERLKVVGFFKNSNVFAFTSEKEVAPLVLLESMASRLPWVSTDVGNTSELSGGTCIRAIKNNSGYSVFDERVCKLFTKHIEDYMLVSNLEAGRLQIEEKMNWPKILPQYLSIIEN